MKINPIIKAQRTKEYEERTVLKRCPECGAALRFDGSCPKCDAPDGAE